MERPGEKEIKRDKFQKGINKKHSYDEKRKTEK